MESISICRNNVHVVVLGIFRCSAQGGIGYFRCAKGALGTHEVVTSLVPTWFLKISYASGKFLLEG